MVRGSSPTTLWATRSEGVEEAVGSPDNTWEVANRALQHYEALIDREVLPRVPAWLVENALGLEAVSDKIVVRPRGSDFVAEVTEFSPGVFARAVSGGSSSILRSYARQEWDCVDLYGLMQTLLDFEHRVLTWRTLLPARRRRSAIGSPWEIATHYELPWALFEPALVANSYSAARLRLEPSSLDEAYALHHLSLLSEALPHGGVLLDLGAGWGGLAEVALNDPRNAVVAVTISESQACAMGERFPNDVASGRLKIVRNDFADFTALPERVDGITMIESVEHMGQFRRLPFLVGLRARYPNARLALQATTKSGRGAERRSRERGALVELVFPGPGALPTTRKLIHELSSAGYGVTKLSDLTSEYVLTALRWKRGFHLAAERTSALRRVGRLFEAYAAATAASLDRGLARNVVLTCVPEEGT